MTDTETKITNIEKRLNRIEDLLAHLIVKHVDHSLCPGGREKAFLFAQAKRQLNLESKHLEIAKNGSKKHTTPNNRQV